MAITITPGYDFGVNEIPRNATLAQQATGLTVGDIPESNIDGSIVKCVINDATAATNFNGEGALWFDSKGNLWGQNRWGKVMVKRQAGGWESNRYKYHVLGAGFDENLVPGYPITIGNKTNNTTPTDCVFTRATTNKTFGYELACSAETMQSNAADAHYRAVFRGWIRINMNAVLNASAPRYVGYVGNAAYGYYALNVHAWSAEKSIEGNSIDVEVNNHQTETGAWVLGFPTLRQAP